MLFGPMQFGADILTSMFDTGCMGETTRFVFSPGRGNLLGFREQSLGFRILVGSKKIDCLGRHRYYGL